MRNLVGVFVFLLLISVLNSGCQKKPSSSEDTTTSSTSSRRLYFASGACTVSNLTASKPYSASQSGYLGKIDISSTAPTIETIYDYSGILGEFPVGIANYDSSYLIVGIETNATNRRIDLVSKTALNNSTGWASGSGALATAFSTTFRALIPAYGVTGQADAGAVNGFLISRSSAIEKISLTKQRQNPLNLPAAAWVASPGSTCGTAATNINTMLATPSGKIIYTHTTAAQNKVAVVNGLGYGASATATNDCYGGLASPDAANSYPSALAYVPNGANAHILVYYSSSTLAKEYLYSYDYDDSTGVLSGGTLVSQNSGYLRGVSSMVYDSTTNALYLANGSTSLPNTIEKFLYAPSTRTVTRVTSASGGSYVPAGTNTQCINSMIIN